MGRFTQADSIIPAGMQGLDRYAYVNNAPVNLTDPSGHMVSDGLNGEGAFSTNKNLTGFIRSRINNSIHTQRSLMIKRHAKTCQVWGLDSFTQADSIIPAGIHPHFMGAGGLDRYAYVNNAPVNLTDPSGHNVDCEIGKGCADDNLGSRDEGASDRDEEENNVDAGDTCKLLGACLNPESMNDLDGAETDPSGIEYVYDCEKTSCPILAIGAGLDFAEGGFILGLSIVVLVGACSAGSFIGCIVAAPGFLTLFVAGATLMSIGAQEIIQINNPDYQIDELFLVHYIFPDFHPFHPKQRIIP